MKNLLLFILCCAAFMAGAQPVQEGKIFPTRETPVHDPVMIKQGATYYVFCTGFGIAGLPSSR